MDSPVVGDPGSNEEKVLWEGHSSHIVNLPVFIVCGLAIGLLLGTAITLQNRIPSNLGLVLAGLSVIPLSVIIGKWLRNRCRRYEVTTERIHLRQGVLARKTDDLELYRVKDYTLDEPFFLRL